MKWPTVAAPFQIIIIPVNAHKSPRVTEASEQLYQTLTANGLEVLLDDRDSVRPGAKFADAELIGIPHRVVVGDRGLDQGEVEYLNRATGEGQNIPIDTVADILTTRVQEELINPYAGS